MDKIKGIHFRKKKLNFSKRKPIGNANLSAALRKKRTFPRKLCRKNQTNQSQVHGTGSFWPMAQLGLVW